MVDCIVCGKPTTSTHWGLDTCRACCVFYRRNREKGAILECTKGKNVCMKIGQESKGRRCRKCRLDRFEEVKASAIGDGLSALSATSPTSENGIKCDKLMHTKLDVTTRHPRQSIIEKIRTNHRALSAYRRTSELDSRGIKISQTEASEEKYELIPATYQLWNRGKKVMICALADFIPATFPEINKLQDSEKALLIRNFIRCFHLLDSVLRVVRRFGNDSTKIVFSSYTSYISLESIEHFFSDCPDRSCVTAASKTLLEIYHEVIPMMNSQVRQISPSDDELLALVGLSFWSTDSFEPSDELLALAAFCRAQIISELTMSYRSAIGEEQGASRIGSLLCMLMEFKRVDAHLQHCYEIFRMLGAFDDDTLAYKLQTLRLD